MRAPALTTLTLTAALFVAPLAAQDWGPWRVLGPFDLGGSEPEAADLPMADELGAVEADGPGLDLSRAFTGRGGERVAWGPLPDDEASRSRRVDVGPIDLGLDAGTRAYIYRKYAAARDEDLDLEFEASGGLRVFWNGRPVLERLGPERPDAAGRALSVVARAGVNHLLVEVRGPSGPGGFRLTGGARAGGGDVNAAIDAGVRFLLDQQQLDGSWATHEGYRAGYTAFAAYTLMKCGLPPGHPAVRRALAFVDARGGDFTYTAACELLARCAAGEGVTQRVRQLVRNLEDWQQSSGLLSYPVHPDGGVRADPDLSNTLYAALALRAAAHAGAKVSPDFWKAVASGTLRNREREHEVSLPDGSVVPAAGFYYWPGAAVTGSMTTAGLGILAIAEQELGRRLSSRDRRELEHARETGLAWLAANMRYDVNPGQDKAHHYFHVYGIERVGSLLGLHQIGGVDWYRAGARYLVEAQDPSGSWRPESELVDTCLALLFLRRATAPQSGKQASLRARSYESGGTAADVVLHAQGDTPLTLFVQGFSKQARAELSWPGEHGAGLHVAHVEYLARPLDAGDGSAQAKVVAEIEADPLRPSGAERFPARVRLPANGTWTVTARVTVWASREGDGLASERAVLESAPLEVEIREVFHDAWLRYPSDPDRNLLVGRDVRVTASSSYGGQLPEQAVDGKLSTRWHCDLADATPWIRIEPKRAFRARRVLLSHAWPRLSHAHAPRPSRVELAVNGDERVLQAEVDPDPLLKTEIDLGKALRIHSLEIRVLASRDRTVGDDAVGFSEIELWAQ